MEVVEVCVWILWKGRKIGYDLSQKRHNTSLLGARWEPCDFGQIAVKGLAVKGAGTVHPVVEDLGQEYITDLVTKG